MLGFLSGGLFCAQYVKRGDAAMLFSRYCPSLRDTGMVSSATGFIDFVSYIAAAVSITLFSNAVTALGGWRPLLLVWAGLTLCGVLVISVPVSKKEKERGSGNRTSMNR